MVNERLTIAGISLLLACCQEVNSLKGIVAEDLISAEPRKVPTQCNASYEGPPCVSFSRLLPWTMRLEAKFCVRDGTHTSGVAMAHAQDSAIVLKASSRLVENARLPDVLKLLSLRTSPRPPRLNRG